MKKTCWYKGTLIEKNYHGYYVAFLFTAGRYGWAETLAGIKKMIREDEKECFVNQD